MNRKSIKSKAAPNFNLPFFIIAVLQFAETVFTDPHIFAGVHIFHYRKYYLLKAIVFVALFLFWQMVPFVIRKVRRKEWPASRLNYFLIYFAVLLVLLILTWPGVWRWDEFNILNYAVSLRFMYWQHWLTSLYYMVCLSIFPFPAGIVMIQAFLIALIVGYILYRLSVFVPGKWVYAVYIPLLFPCVLSNNLYPIRLPVYSYLELLFFALLLFKFLEKTKVTWKDVVVWSVLLALISTWRTEAVFYLVAVPLAMIVLFRKRITGKQLISFFAAAAVMGGAVLVVQAKGQTDDSYFLTGTTEPLHGIFSSPDLNATEEETAAIDKVISVDLLKTTSGDYAFYYGSREGYTKTDLNNYKKAYYELVLRNIPAVVKNRVQLFIKTNGMVRNTNINCGISPQLFTNNLDDSIAQKYTEFARAYPASRPLSVGVRSFIVSVLDCRDTADYNHTNALFPVFWNSLPPLLILLVLMIVELFGKKKALALIPLLILLKTALIFATAPADIFMYYLPVMIVGYVFGVLWLLLKFKAKRRDFK